VRLTSSSSQGTVTTATLTIGGVAGAFSVTTYDMPDALGFTSQTGVALSTLIESNVITVTGLVIPASISITGGDYSVSTDSGSTWSSWSSTLPATVSNNNQVKVRLTSSATAGGTASASLTIGGVTGSFTVTSGYSVTPTADAHSSISPSDVLTVGTGSVINFTVTANPGYGILTVTGCGGALNGDTYTTAAITGNCSVTVTAVSRNGNMGSGADPSITDALRALQAYSGAIQLTDEEKIRYDVAPLSAGGIPLGNGVVDFADVILILRRSIGIGNW
jgi:hypothetical protein